MPSTRSALCVLVVAIWVLACAARQAAGEHEALIEEVRDFETRYLKTVDEGDVRSQLALVSHDPRVYSILDGEIWLGWDAVKAQAEAYVPFSKLVRNVVDKTEVIPLQRDAALVIMQIHSEKKTIAPDKRFVLEFPDHATGVLTHVLVRSHDGWLMLHEHWSTTLTPEMLAFKTALLDLQRKAARKK